MRWNAPLSEAHAELLVDRLGLTAGDHVVDLGCGWGELLIRAVAATAGVRGTGVDSARWALERGRAAAAARGVKGRVDFVEGDAASWTGAADRVLCVGASHAWGGTGAALRALAAVVQPGGRLLMGDGCWAAPATPAATALFGEEVLSLPHLVDAAVAAGWRVLHVSVADQREWDDFESTWRAGREEWLLAHPEDGRSAGLRDLLDDRLRQYVSVYRGVLGFAYVVLGR